MNKNICSRMLREIKDKTEWSQPFIAYKIGVSQPTVSRILNGCDCMGSTVQSIFDLHEEIFKKKVFKKTKR